MVWIKRPLIILLLILILVSLVSADLIVGDGVTQDRFFGVQNQNLDIKEVCFNDGALCSSNTQCNITVFNPQQIVLIDNLAMENMGAYFNRTLTNTTNLGEYQSYINCHDGAINGTNTYDFLITYTGLEPPSDFTKVVFIIGFVVLVFVYLITLIKLISTMFATDTDPLDVIYSIATFLTIIAFNSFNLSYGNNLLIDRVTDLFIRIGAFTHVLVPMYAYAFTIIKNRLKEAGRDRIN